MPSSLKKMILEGDPGFWANLARHTASTESFSQLIVLSNLRRQAKARNLPDQPRKPLRLALIGSYSLYPLRELLEHQLHVSGFACELFLGEFDNWVSEIMDETGALHTFKPEVIFVLPPERLARSPEKLAAPRAQHDTAGKKAAAQLLELCHRLHQATGAEIIVSNFIPPATFDLGTYGTRTLGSDRNFRRFVNLELGLTEIGGVHICDTEFLASRRGLLHSMDERGWFESKQLGSPALLVDLSREIAHLIGTLKQAAKKVLVLDLDNTLWGGVIGDDGLEGIEIGDTSPRGEAFKAFQKYISTLTSRGLLLAVCSKNDLERAREPFEKHPEMVLRLDRFVSFKANWEPKSENIRAIAAELELGLDSLVFVDDNPAEVEIVNQFLPTVSTLLLGPDPASYVRQLQDSRLFEVHTLTSEDEGRTELYRQEGQRNALLASATDMSSYLGSLQMIGTFTEFVPVDVPRISQLNNKSNQFNLTTLRRTEAEVTSIMNDPAYRSFTFRLADRFGDHGLVSVVITRKKGTDLEIDTWLMSCRVLKRQVEEAVANEIQRLAITLQCQRVIGRYRATAKNGMVKDHYPRLGFKLLAEHANGNDYTWDPKSTPPWETKIKIARRAYESTHESN